MTPTLRPVLLDARLICLSMPPQTPEKETAPSLLDYKGLAGRFDECLAPDGQPRPHWERFFALAGQNPTRALVDAGEACRRLIHEQDVSMNVYGGEGVAAKPWPLDAIPLLVEPADWKAIATGLQQRARLYDALLRDVYGPQKLLRSGAVPAPLLMANPRFLRPCAGLARSREPFLHFYAADLARSPDGRWWVIDDRLDAPSGLGYSLQNRIIIREAMPGLFQRAPVHRLYHFFRDFRSSLEHGSASRDDQRVVFLTPGPANETYFEHAYLTQFLGYPLVQGADLTTRGSQVFLRTVGGLRRVDTIVRRVDSEFCDPLELNEDSVLGVPGLVESAHRGRVSLANQLGAGALEGSALLAFLAPLCRSILGEELLLPSAATWWCGQPRALAYVEEHLDSLVIKPAFRAPGMPPTCYGALISKSERDSLLCDLRARPWAYCGQERIFLGTAPALVDRKIRPVPFTSRFFLTWSPSGYRAMPGGLTRFNPDREDAIVSLQQGSVTKDTWVLTDGAVEPPPPLSVSLGPALDVPRAATTSRMADNLFWLGRYLERTARLARMLERLDPLMRDEVAGLEPSVAADAAEMLVRIQGETPAPDSSPAEVTAHALSLGGDRSHPGALAHSASQLVRVAEETRLLLPPEAWKAIRQLRSLLESEEFEASPELSNRLASIEALALETLPRDTGWRFLDLGRRIERGLQLAFVARELAGGVRFHHPGEFRLQTLLHFTDGLFSYRTAFQGGFGAESVGRWIVSDEENPRGLRHQAELICGHLERLPEESSPAAVRELRETAFALLSLVRLANPGWMTGTDGESKRLLAQVTGLLFSLNDQITEVYFAHAQRPVPTAPSLSGAEDSR